VTYLHPGLNQESTVPFFVGVIGHRQIREEEIPRLQREFDSQIKSLLVTVKSTKIVVLTGNAEGADRIPQASQYRKHFSICAVLPFAKEEYAQDFSSKKERAAFDEALNHCDYIVITPNSPSGRIGATMRNKAYQECARWISDNSNLLIGFWDGMEPRGIGGTSETINYRMSDVYAKPHMRERELDFLHIQASNGDRDFKESCECSGHKLDTNQHPKFLNELDNLNRLMEPPQFTPENNQLKSFFQQFDSSATALQKRFNRRTISLFAWALLTLQFVFIQQQTLSLLWLSFSALAMIITITLWWTLWKLKIKSAYETFRFVAELLRIQIWWNECGLKINTLYDDVENHNLEDSTYSLLNNLFLFSKISQPDARPVSKRTKIEITQGAESKWIEDQIRYLVGNNTKSGAIERNRIAAKRGSLIMILSLVLAGIIQTFSMVISLLNVFETESALDWTLKIIFSFFVSVAASLAAYAKLMGFKEIKILYDLKLRRLEMALAKLSRLETKADSALIVKNVGIASLRESLRWFQLKSDREIRPFQA
jgi:hypothetical protein